ncbi:alcohol dehydrogenase catalytic domain-containing protein [Kutzneria kofuensis]|uniref:alcohol dehydrogenase catalytic domain-containing protein n=1 Tax=Kutzneria kofuensis TaxID=103725 RepID=UPI0035E40886
MVRLRAEAIGVNFASTQERRGIFYAGNVALPASPGGDVVGYVDALGEGVTNVAVGDRVTGVAFHSSYADYSLAPAKYLVSVPAEMDAAEATMLTSPGQVALEVLKAGRLAEGESVLVHAAAGSIGHLAVQLAGGSSSSSPRRTPRPIGHHCPHGTRTTGRTPRRRPVRRFGRCAPAVRTAARTSGCRPAAPRPARRPAGRCAAPRRPASIRSSPARPRGTAPAAPRCAGSGPAPARAPRTPPPVPVPAADPRPAGPRRPVRPPPARSRRTGARWPAASAAAAVTTRH